MRSLLVAAAFAILAPLSAATAAPMSTSDLLRPHSAVTEARHHRCHSVCRVSGWCGRHLHRHRCCLSWKRVCH